MYHKPLLLLSLLFFLSNQIYSQCGTGAPWQCDGTQTSTANPASNNGQYVGGTVVTFCYTMQNYGQCDANWLHTINIDLGPGWDASTLTAISWPTSCDGFGVWGFYASSTASVSGNTYGPCFAYDSPLGFPGGVLDGIPGNNYGDDCMNYTWTFCFSVMVATGCSGQSLDVNVTAVGDGSGGSWTSPTCPGAPFNVCNAVCLQCTLALADTVTNPGCLNNDGVITITPSGGAGFYTFSWAPGGQTDSSITGLSSGEYVVTVLDSIGCKSLDTLDLTSVNPVALTDAVTNAKCYGYCDGTAFIFPAGGTEPYAFSWLPNGQITSSDTALCAGTYYVSVTDSNSCLRIDTIVITSPSQIVLTPSQQDISCFGGNDGWATVDATGGNGIYYFNWNPTGQNSDTAKNLYVGSYTVTATDLNGCFTDTTITLTGPPQIIVAPTITNVSCYGSADGAISTLVSQGIPPYEYLWISTNQTTSAINYLIAGAYPLLVTDSHGCEELDTFEVIQPDSLSGVLDIKPTSCPGATDGSIAIEVTGGTPPYQYLWNNDLTLTTPSLSNLAAGNYQVLVTDNHGCTLTMADDVKQLPDLVVDAGADVSINLGTSTILNAYVDRTGTYYYDWTPGYNLTDSTGASTYAFPFYTTTYVVKVEDVYSGCEGYDTVTVTILPSSYVLLPSAFTPNGDGLNDLLFPVMGDLAQLESFKIFNRWGEVVFSDKTRGWDGKNQGRPEEVGTYVYEVKYHIEGRTGQVYTVTGSVTLLR